MQMTLPIAQKFRRLAATVSLLLLAFTLLPAAGAQETTAAIQGTVTDPSGAIVPDAAVVATSNSLISKAVAKTDSHGFYRLNALPPGNYTVTVTGGGMSFKATDLKLSAGDLPNLNVRLTVSGTEAIIDVSSAVAMVDVTQSRFFRRSPKDALSSRSSHSLQAPVRNLCRARHPVSSPEVARTAFKSTGPAMQKILISLRD
jgi:hypothetical protein